MSKKILVIDDDKSSLVLAEKILSKDGFEVITLEHPKKFLKSVRKEKPDLVLLDILLPETDGYKLCEEIRKLYGDKIPIMLCTAKVYEKEFLKDSYKDFGANHFVIKPFDATELLDKVRGLTG